MGVEDRLFLWLFGFFCGRKKSRRRFFFGFSHLLLRRYHFIREIDKDRVRNLPVVLFLHDGEHACIRRNHRSLLPFHTEDHVFISLRGEFRCFQSFRILFIRHINRSLFPGRIPLFHRGFRRCFRILFGGLRNHGFNVVCRGIAGENNPAPAVFLRHSGFSFPKHRNDGLSCGRLLFLFLCRNHTGIPVFKRILLCIESAFFRISIRCRKRLIRFLPGLFFLFSLHIVDNIADIRKIIFNRREFLRLLNIHRRNFPGFLGKDFLFGSGSPAEGEGGLHGFPYGFCRLLFGCIERNILLFRRRFPFFFRNDLLRRLRNFLGIIRHRGFLRLRDIYFARQLCEKFSRHIDVFAGVKPQVDIFAGHPALLEKPVFRLQTRQLKHPPVVRFFPAVSVQNLNQIGLGTVLRPGDPILQNKTLRIIFRALFKLVIIPVRFLKLSGFDGNRTQMEQDSAALRRELACQQKKILCIGITPAPFIGLRNILQNSRLIQKVQIQ